MTPLIVRDRRTGQGFATREKTFIIDRGLLNGMDPSHKSIAKRLVATRLALGFEQQTEFCDAIGVLKNVYNPFEKGSRRISLDVALKIRARFGVPLDWTFCGDPANLPQQVYRNLRLAA